MGRCGYPNNFVEKFAVKRDACLKFQIRKKNLTISIKLYIFNGFNIRNVPIENDNFH